MPRVPNDVALFIAQNIRSNVRELEGALIRLLAYCSLTGAEVTVQTAQQVLKNFIEQQTRKITIDSHPESRGRTVWHAGSRDQAEE